MNNVPPCLQKYFSAVKCLEDGKIILASSSLTGRYWNGSLWCFPNVESVPEVEKSIASIDTVCGVTDILCLDKNFIVGKDSGSIEIYTLESEDSYTSFQILFSTLEHEDVISSLDLNSDKSRFVSSSYDKSIKVWDPESCISEATFKPVHAGVVWQISCSNTDPKIIISCGSDGLLLLLDLRLPKPATIIKLDSGDDKPTSVCWKPQSNSDFAVGMQSGNIMIRDIRKTSPLHSFSEHNRSIFKLAFSATKPSWLASCSRSPKVLITDIEKGKPSKIYTNEDHIDLVSGLTWDLNNDLISCGFDSRLLRHSVIPPDKIGDIPNDL